MTQSSAFDATASFVGYLYQVRYALLLALRKIDDCSDPDNCLISIERLDDIAFEDSGSPVELLQTKHHTNPGNITDRSPDLWKTIRVWSEFLAAQPNNFESATFTLITTENGADDSIAQWLGTDAQKRNQTSAIEAMRDICQETENATNKKAYEAFGGLETWQQEKLVNSIYVIGLSPDIESVRELLLRRLRSAVASEHVEPFLTRLEGKWFARIISLLDSDTETGISLSELISTLDDLRNQFLPSNLPADFGDAIPDNIDLDGDTRNFVEQLRLIGANNSVLNTAVVNFYRAYEQRSRWSKDNLLRPGEIKTYLNRLKDEWETHRGLLEMEFDLSQHESKVGCGLKLFSKCQLEAMIPIRPEFSANYVARGSYHTLADTLEIGWHPDYQSHFTPDESEGAA